jgi:tetratricopeptide (TPR) repeat protein
VEAYFLIGCSHLSTGNFECASQAFNKADEEAKKQGKKNIDSLLIGQAFAYYKLNQREKAISYLHAANQLNPYRLSVRRYLEMWQRGNQ